MDDSFGLAPDRRALVTGGASGIGADIARALVDRGVGVVVADLAGQLERAALPGGVRGTVAMDVTDEASVSSGVHAAAAVLGGLDTVVNSAGVFQFRKLEDITADEWDWILSVNLRGTFLVMRESMPLLKASGRGAIVNISSDAGKRGWPLLAAYTASKFGVVGLTQAVAAEVGPDGVRVNAVCPATIAETGMGQKVLDQKVELGWGTRDEVLERGARSFPLQRVGRARDVTAATIFLLSEGADWITGESLNVDGGSLAG